MTTLTSGGIVSRLLEGTAELRVGLDGECAPALLPADRKAAERVQATRVAPVNAERHAVAGAASGFPHGVGRCAVRMGEVEDGGVRQGRKLAAGLVELRLELARSECAEVDMSGPVRSDLPPARAGGPPDRVPAGDAEPVNRQLLAVPVV